MTDRTASLRQRSAVLVFVAVWLVGAVLLALVLTILSHPSRSLYQRLAKHGVAVTGVVTRTAAQDHATVYYSFDVAGRTYSGSRTVGLPNPPIDELLAGDHIVVVYDRRDPDVSCPCAPNQELAADSLFDSWRGRVLLCCTRAAPGGRSDDRSSTLEP